MLGKWAPPEGAKPPHAAAGWMGELCWARRLLAALKVDKIDSSRPFDPCSGAVSGRLVSSWSVHEYQGAWSAVGSTPPGSLPSDRVPRPDGLGHPAAARLALLGGGGSLGPRAEVLSPGRPMRTVGGSLALPLAVAAGR